MKKANNLEKTILASIFALGINSCSINSNIKDTNPKQINGAPISTIELNSINSNKIKESSLENSTLETPILESNSENISNLVLDDFIYYFKRGDISQEYKTKLSEFNKLALKIHRQNTNPLNTSQISKNSFPPQGYKLAGFFEKAKITGYTPFGPGLMANGYTPNGKTSTGRNARKYDGAASSPKCLPYGAIVYIPSLNKMYLIDDTGGIPKKSCEEGILHIDIRVPNIDQANKLTRTEELVVALFPEEIDINCKSCIKN